MSLLLLNIPLILMEQYFAFESVLACGILSIILHFALLTTIAWMTVEAVNVYLTVLHVGRNSLIEQIMFVPIILFIANRFSA